MILEPSPETATDFRKGQLNGWFYGSITKKDKKAILAGGSKILLQSPPKAMLGGGSTTWFSEVPRYWGEANLSSSSGLLVTKHIAINRHIYNICMFCLTWEIHPLPILPS